MFLLSTFIHISILWVLSKYIWALETKLIKHICLPMIKHLDFLERKTLSVDILPYSVSSEEVNDNTLIILVFIDAGKLYG